jgi:hypothetical protein
METANRHFKYKSSQYAEIKCQLDATDDFYCRSCFGHHYAHHQELESITKKVAACGIWCFGFQVVGMVLS